MELFLAIVFSVLIFGGLFLVFIPFLPALFYMLIVASIFALIGGFEIITKDNLFLLAAIVLLSFLIDLLSGVIGAKWGGASKQGLFYGILGLVAGTLLLPPFGGIAGLFAGVLFGETLKGKTLQRAVKAAGSSTIGVLTGIVANLILATAFFVLFIIFLIF